MGVDQPNIKRLQFTTNAEKINKYNKIPETVGHVETNLKEQLKKVFKNTVDYNISTDNKQHPQYIHIKINKDAAYKDPTLKDKFLKKLEDLSASPLSGKDGSSTYRIKIGKDLNKWQHRIESGIADAIRTKGVSNNILNRLNEITENRYNFRFVDSDSSRIQPMIPYDQIPVWKQHTKDKEINSQDILTQDQKGSSIKNISLFENLIKGIFTSHRDALIRKKIKQYTVQHKDASKISLAHFRDRRDHVIIYHPDQRKGFQEKLEEYLQQLDINFYKENDKINEKTQNQILIPFPPDMPLKEMMACLDPIIKLAAAIEDKKPEEEILKIVEEAKRKKELDPIKLDYNKEDILALLEGDKDIGEEQRGYFAEKIPQYFRKNEIENLLNIAVRKRKIHFISALHQVDIDVVEGKISDLYKEDNFDKDRVLLKYLVNSWGVKETVNKLETLEEKIGSQSGVGNDALVKYQQAILQVIKENLNPYLDELSRKPLVLCQPNGKDWRFVQNDNILALYGKLTAHHLGGIGEYQDRMKYTKDLCLLSERVYGLHEQVRSHLSGIELRNNLGEVIHDHNGEKLVIGGSDHLLDGGVEEKMRWLLARDFPTLSLEFLDGLYYNDEQIKLLTHPDEKQILTPVKKELGGYAVPGFTELDNRFFIPYNLGDHWVTIIVEKPIMRDGQKGKIFYIDPFGNQKSLDLLGGAEDQRLNETEVKDILGDLFQGQDFKNYQFDRTDIEFQIDSENCGLHIIEIINFLRTQEEDVFQDLEHLQEGLKRASLPMIDLDRLDRLEAGNIEELRAQVLDDTNQLKSEHNASFREVAFNNYKQLEEELTQFNENLAEVEGIYHTYRILKGQISENLQTDEQQAINQQLGNLDRALYSKNFKENLDKGFTLNYIRELQAKFNELGIYDDNTEIQDTITKLESLCDEAKQKFLRDDKTQIEEEIDQREGSKGGRSDDIVRAAGLEAQNQIALKGVFSEDYDAKIRKERLLQLSFWDNTLVEQDIELKPEKIRQPGGEKGVIVLKGQRIKLDKFQEFLENSERIAIDQGGEIRLNNEEELDKNPTIAQISKVNEDLQIKIVEIKEFNKIFDFAFQGEARGWLSDMVPPGSRAIQKEDDSDQLGLEIEKSEPEIQKAFQYLQQDKQNEGEQHSLYWMNIYNVTSQSGLEQIIKPALRNLNERGENQKLYNQAEDINRYLNDKFFDKDGRLFNLSKKKPFRLDNSFSKCYCNTAPFDQDILSDSPELRSVISYDSAGDRITFNIGEIKKQAHEQDQDPVLWLEGKLTELREKNYIKAQKAAQIANQQSFPGLQTSLKQLLGITSSGNFGLIFPHATLEIKSDVKSKIPPEYSGFIKSRPNTYAVQGQYITHIDISGLDAQNFANKIHLPILWREINENDEMKKIAAAYLNTNFEFLDKGHSFTGIVLGGDWIVDELESVEQDNVDALKLKEVFVVNDELEGKKACNFRGNISQTGIKRLYDFTTKVHDTGRFIESLKEKFQPVFKEMKISLQDFRNDRVIIDIPTTIEWHKSKNA